MFSIAVRDYLLPHENLFTKINTLMVKLRTMLLKARLRSLTTLRLKMCHATRWSSTFKMIWRYLRIREFLPALESRAAHELSLSTSQNRRGEETMEKLNKF